MDGKFNKYCNRNMIMYVIVTSAILWFYSVLYIYLIGLALFIIFTWINYNVIKFTKYLKEIAISVVIVFILTILGEILLHLSPHFMNLIGGVDTLGNFSDYISRGYLTEDVFKKRKDSVRILGLGDSFAVYLGYCGKNYHNILQEKYLASGKENVEVVNAGIESIGPGYYWHILNKYGDSFKPDLVVVGFFVGNDFNEAQFDIVIGDHIREPNDIIKKYFKYYRFCNWRLYKLYRNVIFRYQESRNKLQERRNSLPSQVGSFSRDTFLKIEMERSWIFEKNKHDKYGKLNRIWQECADIFLRMKKWCDKRNIELVIAIFPDQFQVDKELRGEVFNRYKDSKKRSPEDMDLSYPNNLIINFCRAHDIHCLDLLEQFQRQGKNQQLYALRDTHWNAAGNQLAADLIFAYLEENQLLPSRPPQ
jgi:hypothetical protein